MTFIHVFLYNFRKLLKLGCYVSICFAIVGCFGFMAGAGFYDVVLYIAASVANTAVAMCVLTIAVSLYDIVH